MISLRGGLYATQSEYQGWLDTFKDDEYERICGPRSRMLATRKMFPELIREILERKEVA